jgi:hypothetical protein
VQRATGGRLRVLCLNSRGWASAVISLQTWRIAATLVSPSMLVLFLLERSFSCWGLSSLWASTWWMGFEAVRTYSYIITLSSGGRVKKMESLFVVLSLMMVRSGLAPSFRLSQSKQKTRHNSWLARRLNKFTKSEVLDNNVVVDGGRGTPTLRRKAGVCYCTSR